MIRGRHHIAAMSLRDVLVGILVVLVLGTAVAAPMPAVADHEDNETDVGAGEYVVSGLAVERVVVDGAVERRRFERDVRAAASARARAEVVARYLTASRDRLDALERRETTLDDAVANGSMRPGEHAARTARLAAAATNVRRLATSLEATASDLPRDVRRDAGVELATIRQLRADATALAERTGGLDTPDGAVYATIERMVGAYNERGDPAGLFGEQLRNERVNLYVDTPESTGVVSFRVDENDRITQVRAGPRGDATLRMETDDRTVRRIADATDPAAALRDAAETDRVTVTGIGPLNQLKWTIVDLLSSMRDLL